MNNSLLDEANRSRWEPIWFCAEVPGITVRNAAAGGSKLELEQAIRTATERACNVVLQSISGRGNRYTAQRFAVEIVHTPSHDGPLIKVVVDGTRNI